MHPPEPLDLVADNGLDADENPPVIVGVVDGTSAVDLADVLAKCFLRRGRLVAVCEHDQSEVQKRAEAAREVAELGARDRADELAGDGVELAAGKLWEP